MELSVIRQGKHSQCKGGLSVLNPIFFFFKYSTVRTRDQNRQSQLQVLLFPRHLGKGPGQPSTNTYHCTFSKQAFGGAQNAFTNDPNRSGRPRHRPPFTLLGTVVTKCHFYVPKYPRMNTEAYIVSNWTFFWENRVLCRSMSMRPAQGEQRGQSLFTSDTLQFVPHWCCSPPSVNKQINK